MVLARDERIKWREQFEGGCAVEGDYYLDQYRHNRDNPYWRSSRGIEYLCEYILYLESKVELLQMREVVEGGGGVRHLCNFRRPNHYGGCG